MRQILLTLKLVILLFYFIFSSGQVAFSQNKSSSSGYINAGQIRIYYEREGKGDPLLFLHAGFQDHRMWEEQLKFFKKTNEVIVLDLPGHGLSSGKDTNYLVTSVLKILLDSLNIHKASLIGLSLGSGIALEFALTHPDRINKLVMISPAVPGIEKKYPVNKQTLTFFDTLFDRIDNHDTAAAAEIFTHFWFDGPGRKSAEAPKQARVSVYNTTYQTMIKHKVEGWPRFNRESTSFDLLPTLSVPLMLIVGKLDALSCLEAADYISKNVKGSQFIEIYGAAHMVNLEYPGLINKNIAAFVNARQQ